MADDATDPSAQDGESQDPSPDQGPRPTSGEPATGAPILPGVPYLAGGTRLASGEVEGAGTAGATGGDENHADAHAPTHPDAETAAMPDADSPATTDGTAVSADAVSGDFGAASGHTAPDRSGENQLTPYEVPTSIVPPSILQGPTITVQAPTAAPGVVRPADSTTSGDPDPDGSGWQPSGSREPSRAPSAGSGRPSSAEKVRAEDGQGERSARREKESGPEPASALTADRLLSGAARPPVSGWRRWLYTATLGRVNVGDSDAVRVQRALEHRISVRLGDRTRYVPVLSRKGGVGKTTVTTLLGMALADIREDRIIAMDANPDRGTLSDRSPGRAEHTARQLVQNRYSIDSFAQLAGYVTRDGSRLHVLASDTDPAVAQAFDDADYRAVTDVLSRYYSVVLTDSGTGMVHSVMKGTLEKADSVVLVSGGSVDEARLASETLSWLEAHGRQDLLARAIVVINLSSGNGTQVDVSQIEQHFRSRVSTVVRIPYDRHLAEGSRVDLSKLNPVTRRAVVELAALVVDQLAS